MSGKLRAQRAKSMKFKDGYMVSSGNPVREYIDSATRHVLLRQVRLQEKEWTLSHRQQCLHWQGSGCVLATCFRAAQTDGQPVRRRRFMHYGSVATPEPVYVQKASFRDVCQW